MAIKDVDDDDAADSSRNYRYPTFGTCGHEALQRAEGFDGDIIRERERPRRTDTAGDMASWAGQPAIKGSTETMRMALLTFSLIGLQYVQLADWWMFG
jgi:hypothetical protein